MAVDYNKGIRPNVYELMQGGGGGSYELPPATDETLGGVIIGRGIDVEPNGTISVTAPAPADTYTKAEIDAQQADQNSRIAANAMSIANAEVDISNIEQDIDEITQNYPPRISALETSQTAQDTAITALQTHEQQQDTAISVNASAILANTRAIEDIAQDIQDIAADYAPRISALETSQAAQDTIISGIQTDIGDINTHQTEQDTNIGNNASAILDLETDLETLSTTIADDSTLGLVKTDSSKNISTDENGKLLIDGRLGQFTDGGVFYPTTAEPTNVGASSFLITDGAKNISVGVRTFGIMAGANLTCKSAAAGTTQYHLTNNQSNRFACFACSGGRLAIDQTDAIANGTAEIISITFADETPIAAYFGPTETDNDIIITVDRTVNPDAATKKLRIYGMSVSSDVINIGQGNGATHGKALALGQSCKASGNQTIAFGNSSIVMANNSVAFGHTHLVNKQFCFAAGQGHDFTNASNGAAAVGICSDISSDTLFAVGNGVYASNGNITRSNALEVTADGGIVLKSNGGNKFKVTVDDYGNLTTTAI